MSKVKYRKDFSLRQDEEGYPYKPSKGAFALIDEIDEKEKKVIFGNKGDFVYCREEFNGDYFAPQENKAILFAHPANKGINVARFLHVLETKLKLKTFSEVVGFKGNANISLIKFAPWWIANIARWELFTIFLRCGTAYKTSFKKALLSNEYIVETETAVRKFLDGNTHYPDRKMDYGYNGWVSHFGETGEYGYDEGYGEKMTVSYRELQKRISLLSKTAPRKKKTVKKKR